MKFRTALTLLLLLAGSLSLAAQQLTGTVCDAKTGEPLAFANVYYEDGKATQTDENGNFSKPWKRGRLYVSMVGYEAQHFNVKAARHLEVRLEPLPDVFATAVVEGKREKYSRKDNPAVALMRHVIAAKERSDLRKRDFYSIDRYSKMVFAIDNVKPENFESGILKSLSFLRDNIEVCNQTGRYILPISVEETAATSVWRRDKKQAKTIITGKRANGLNDILSTGENLNVLLKDIFTDVNIYDEECRLLQFPFRSPLSAKFGIQFYRFFLGDTLNIAGERCIQVSFTPNNAQDFGFSGELYIVADSSYRVKMVDLRIPKRSDVNFVDDMRIIQQFAPLETGEQVLVRDDMLVHMKLTDFLSQMQVTRTTEMNHFDFGVVPDRTFAFEGTTRLEPNANMRDDEFWERQTAAHAANQQQGMSNAVSGLRQKKAFKYVIPVVQAVVENFVETGKKLKVDIGPVNTLISFNKVEKVRLRASLQTTANLNPHLFFKGYVAYGFRDHRWKGSGDVVYSFNRKAYRPHEFPMRNLTFNFTDDVISPSDKFLGPDKDNVFKALKWNTTDLMLYVRSFKINYTHEWGSGLQVWGQVLHERTTPTLSMTYQSLSSKGPSANPADHVRHLHNSNIGLGLRYQPGSTYINTKQHRFETNFDSPVLSLSHTIGLKNVLGSEYRSNITEAGIYKRFWVGSWGKIDCNLSGKMQWDKVPYPYLLIPSANQSYFMEPGTFAMIKNMEFLSDRQVEAHFSWDMNGKILNRIPLIRRLKWREYIGVNALWGHLSAKNNPFVHTEDANLFYFPGQWDANGTYQFLSRTMDKRKPYVEVFFGVHNVFKFFYVDVFRRLNYLDTPGVKKWGVRFMFEITF